MRDYISHSQISLYLQCPLKYAFQYIDGIRLTYIPSSMAFGRSIHRAIASFYETAQEGKPFRLKAWLKVFEEDWKETQEKEEIRYAKGEDYETLLRQGQELLRTYARKMNPQKVIAVEESFSVDLEDPESGEILPLPLQGVVDLVEEDQNGNVVVVDHKTAKRRYADWQIDGNLQLSIYAYAAKEMGWCTSEEVLCRLDVLLKTKKPQVIHYYVTKGKEDFVKLYQIVSAIREAMQAEIVYPRYGYWCGDCPYLDRCREW